MRLFSFLPSCLHSPYNTMRKPRDSAANIACHHDMAISIIRKHQAVAPGWSQQVSSDKSDETTWEGSPNHLLHLADSLRIFSMAVDKLNKVANVGNGYKMKNKKCTSLTKYMMFLIFPDGWRLLWRQHVFTGLWPRWFTGNERLQNSNIWRMWCWRVLRFCSSFKFLRVNCIISSNPGWLAKYTQQTQHRWRDRDCRCLEP